MGFIINISEDFEKYLDSLGTIKKSIIISKLFFIKYTGYLGNCRALGNNIFEYKNDDIKDIIKYVINNNDILFFIKNNDKTIDFNDYINDLLKDEKFIKVFYNESFKNYKQNNEEQYFNDVLNNILKIHGEEKFKQITGFNYCNITNELIKNINDLKDRLNFIQHLKSIDYIVEKTKVKKENIQEILKIKENINLNDLQKLIKFFNK